jgi:hypothetical protein
MRRERGEEPSRGERSSERSEPGREEAVAPKRSGGEDRGNPAEFFGASEERALR